jgi:hypothetical protein
MHPLLPQIQDGLPTSLLKHTNAEHQSRAVKMFASVLQYMGVHGDTLGSVAAVELVQKLLHQGLKRPELRDELYMQLVKQTRGCPAEGARTKAWQLFYLTASVMPPTKDFTGLVSGEGHPAGCRPGWRRLWQPPAAAAWVPGISLAPPRAGSSAPATGQPEGSQPASDAPVPIHKHYALPPPPPAEYVHAVLHDESEPADAREWATKTWAAMKRTARAGQRRTLPDMAELDAQLKGTKQTTIAYFLDETFEELAFDSSTSVVEAVEQLAGQIKLENYSTFTLFAVSKVRLVVDGCLVWVLLVGQVCRPAG